MKAEHVQFSVPRVWFRVAKLYTEILAPFWGGWVVGTMYSPEGDAKPDPRGRDIEQTPRAKDLTPCPEVWLAVGGF